MKLPDIKTPSGAVFSPCGIYRPVLWRYWGPGIAFLHICGLNPSTATAELNDPTVRREIAFAKAWGYDGLIKTNAYDFRATVPKVMLAHAAPCSDDNDDWIYQCTTVAAGPSVAAWGVNIRPGRERQLQNAYQWRCFGKTKAGYPKHPLYLPKTTVLVPFN